MKYTPTPKCSFVQHFLKQFQKLMATQDSVQNNVTDQAPSQVRVYMPRGPKKRTSKSRIVWIDCEMTGLEIENGHRLVEIACIITESNLDTVAEFGPVVIRQPPEVIANMSLWCKATFAKNGLTTRILNSTTSEEEAEKMLLAFLKKHTIQRESPIAGNSVHMDKMFLTKYMPSVINHLHYRIVDVSTVKELVKRWYSEEQLQKVPEKKLNHLALDDIRESITELKYYQANFFREVAESEQPCISFGQGFQEVDDSLSRNSSADEH